MIKCNSVSFFILFYFHAIFSTYNSALISNHIKYLNIFVIKNNIKILFGIDSNLTFDF